MFHKKLLITLMVFAAAGSAAALLPGESNGGARAPRTIGLLTGDGADQFVVPFETGGQSAATALGDHLAITRVNDTFTQISTIKSLIAQHAAAIAIHTTGRPADVKQVLPAIARAHAAGIATVSYENRFPGSVWVNQASEAQFAQALADALASQLNQRGQFVIVSCLRSAGAYPIVRTRLKLTKAYIRRRYPQMHRVGIAYGDLGGDVDTHLFNRLLRAHPQLRGLIFLCPGEAYDQPPLLVRAHKVGQVFTAGNGGGCPPVDDPYLTSVRLGAEEIVCEGDPAKLGYLTVWAADYLASGHTFAPGSYDVGGPVGTVQYFSHNQELRLGQPITITKANVDQYAGQPCPPETPWPCL